VSERLGAAFVEVLADTSEFGRSLESGVGDAMRGIGDQIGDSLGGATDKVRRSLTETLDGIGTSLQQTGKKLEGFGGTLNKKVTLPIIGIGTAAVAAFTTVDKGLSEIGKATGATGDELAGMGDVFQTILRSVPEPASVVAAAIGDLNTRLGVTGDALEAVTREALDFARVNNVDVASATQVVGKLLNALEVDAADAGLVMDKLTLAAQMTGISATGLAQNILDAGPAFEELGFGLDKSIALFASFEAAGARPEEVIGSLNLAINKMAQEAGKLDELERGLLKPSELFDDLLESIKEAPDILAATTLASEVFGSRVGAKVAEDIRAGRFEVDDFAEVIAAAGGTVLKTAEETQTFGDRMAIAKNEVLLLGASFGEILAPMIEQAVGAIRGLLERFQDMSPEQREMIVRFGLIAAAVGPVVLILGKLITAVGSIVLGASKFIKGLVAVGKAFVVLGKFILANPLFLIAALLVAIGYVIWKFRDEIIAALVGAWEFVRDRFVAVWEAIKAAFSAAVDAVMGLARSVIERLSEIWSGIVETIQRPFFAVVDWFKEWWPLLLAVFAFPVFAVLAMWNKWGDSIKEFFVNIWTNITGFLKDSFQRLSNLFLYWWTGPIAQNLVEPLMALIERVREFLSNLLNAIRDRFNQIRDTTRTAWNRIKDAVLGPIQELWNRLTGLLGQIRDRISGVFTDALNVIRGRMGEWGQIGRDIIQGIINGITGAAGRLFNSLRDLAGNALGAAKRALGISSPSRLFAGIGADTVAGFVEGIRDGLGDVDRVLGTLGREIPIALQPSLPPGFGGIGGGSGGQTVSVVINNPVAEPSSESINRELRKLAAVGVFGV